MANRVTADEVKEIIEYDSSTVSSLSAMITAANELVTELCTSSGYTDTRLKEIERWLAGHFYVMVDQTPSEEKIGKSDIKYQNEMGMMLKHSKQGQQALLLDTDGNLARMSRQIELGEKAEITIDWMGQDYDTEDTTD